jgi:hypothetical protein
MRESLKFVSKLKQTHQIVVLEIIHPTVTIGIELILAIVPDAAQTRDLVVMPGDGGARSLFTHPHFVSMQ